MSNLEPRVSIGLPVFNGERHLEAALHSILAQTFSDFELIISDNASTDRTGEICRDLAARDGRIRYYLNERNIGGARNFNRVFELSTAPYFKWAAHDDMIDPAFLSRCVEVLDQDPSVVLCFTKVKVVDDGGQSIGDYKLELKQIGSPRPRDRFADLVLIDHLCLHIFGLIRSDALRKTSLHGSFIASDRVLLAELGLLGRFHDVAEPLFLSRDHGGRSIRALPINFRRAWFDPQAQGGASFPHWRTLGEYLRLVHRLRLGPSEKMTCYLHIVHWLSANLNWARMVTDVIIAVAPGSYRVLSNLKRYYRDEDYWVRSAGGR
ncbi:MAG TPA: glycosyltransferase [Methylomirabilota bacterium]|jgi:glycosyltransferase involved in cell wall biosynthesis